LHRNPVVFQAIVNRRLIALLPLVIIRWLSVSDVLPARKNHFVFDTIKVSMAGSTARLSIKVCLTVTIYALPLPEPAVFRNFYLDDGRKIRFRKGERD
jgi:hypothetical protein